MLYLKNKVKKIPLHIVFFEKAKPQYIVAFSNGAILNSFLV